MKKVTTLFFVLFLAPMVLMAQNQNWSDGTIFPDTLNTIPNVHGIAVDNNDRIWVQSYYPIPGDSVLVTNTGEQSRVVVINIFNPDGSEIAESPLKIIDMKAGGQDTLGGFWNSEKNTFEYRSGRGLVLNHEGNMLAAFYNTLYLIDTETFEGIAMVDGTDNGLDDRGMARPAVDKFGNVYVTGVFPGDPINVYSATLEFESAVVAETGGFSRGFEVSPDGNTIWFVGYDNRAMVRYTRPSDFDPYDQVPDTVLKGLSIESLSVHPKTKYLWVSSGSPSDPVNTFPGAETNYQIQKWYAFDYATLGTAEEVPLDSMAWNLDGGFELDGRPRAIDFSNDGTVAYIGQFNQSSLGLQKVTTSQVFTSNEDNLSEIPEGFSLEQNYPNPFNPSTTINYSLNQAGKVTLKVYDITGREVATLVNSTQSAGAKSVSFDATNLASGIYIYTLQANGLRLTNRMTLIK